MRIYKKNNYLWKIPDETSQELTIKLIEDFNFEVSNDEGINHSDYTVICCVRNPYDRVLSLFINLEVVPHIALTKEIRNTLIKYFREWVNLCFDKKKLVVDLNDYGKNSKIVGCLKQPFFSDKIPEFFIKYENINEDLRKLDLFSEDEIIKKEIIHNPNDIKYNFKDFYDFETAKLVYEHFFSQFHLIGYDPFSFTDENLDDNIKIKFIHDTF